MYRFAWPIHLHSSITACAEVVCGRTLPRHAFLERPTSRFRDRRPGQYRRILEKALRLGADVVLLDLEVAVEQDDRKRAREPLIAAVRELGWVALLGSPRINGLVRHWYCRVIVEVIESGAAGVGTR